MVFRTGHHHQYCIWVGTSVGERVGVIVGVELKTQCVALAGIAMKPDRHAQNTPFGFVGCIAQYVDAGSHP